MNSLKSIISMFAMTLVLISCQSAPKKSQVATERTRFPMGTVASIKIFHGQVTEEVQGFIERDIEAILDIIDQYDKVLSHYKESSSVARLKKFAGLGTWTDSPKELKEALSKSEHYYKVSSGLLDPTLEPLIKLWGFSVDPRDLTKEGLPKRRFIVDALSKSGFEKVIESSDGYEKVRLTKKGASLNFGAMGKGLALDDVSKRFKKLGYSSVLVQLGGQQLFIGDGKFDNQPWIIGVGHPFNKEAVVRKFKLKKAGSVSTSNSSENYKEINGRRYHHILDPRSGKPLVREVVGATVFSDSASDADALSTIFFLTGPKEAERILKKQYPKTAAYLLLNTGAEKYLGNWKEWVEVQK